MQHYNTTITENMNRILNLKGGESTNEIGDVIIPTIEIIPQTDVLGSGKLINSTSQNLFNSSADKDTYITGVSYSFIKDVTSTATQIFIACTIRGVLKYIYRIACITLTPQTGQDSFSFPPIKIDKNTAVSIVSDTNVANIGVCATILGYTTETLKGG